MADRTLKLSPTESITVRRSDSELLEVEATYPPGAGGPPPKHYHPAQDEHFEVLEGRLRARVEGEQRDLGPGEQIDIPRGSVHQMWNPGEDTTRVLWQTRPGGAPSAGSPRSTACTARAAWGATGCPARSRSASC